MQRGGVAGKTATHSTIHGLNLFRNRARIARAESMAVHPPQGQKRGPRLNGGNFFTLACRWHYGKSSPVEVFHRGQPGLVFRQCFQVGAIIILAGQNPQAVKYLV